LSRAAGGDNAPSSGGETTTATSATTPSAPEDLDRVVKIDSDRSLYVRCTGTGSPTVIMEGGDEDTSDSYAFAEPTVSRLTRTCVYDRANLGQSDPASGPRGLSELVGDLERLVEVAKVPAPYVLVGTSGGAGPCLHRHGRPVPKPASRDRGGDRPVQPGER
jgi:hypothetical protein